MYRSRLFTRELSPSGLHFRSTLEFLCVSLWGTLGLATTTLVFDLSLAAEIGQVLGTSG